MIYKLNTHTGETICFSTMGDVLHHLNAGSTRETNPYLGNTDLMHLCYAGIVYPIAQGERSTNIAPSFAHDFKSAYEHILKWLDEMMVYAKDEAGAIKPPQQMTRDQWMAITALSGAAFGQLPMFSSKQLHGYHVRGDQEFTSLSHFYCQAFFERFAYGHNGPLYDGQQTNSRHDVHVAYALSRNEAISEDVLMDYRDAKRGSDIHWFPEVLEKPFLRGSFRSISDLSALLMLMKKNNLKLTEENTALYVQLLQSLDTNAGLLEIDDVLYRHGLLQVREQPSMPLKEALGQPINAFAAKLQVMLGTEQRNHQNKLLAARYEQKRVTAREHDWEKIYNESLPQRQTANWANRVTQAITDRNLPAMLAILDSPDNVTSQRAVEQEFGIKLLCVSAAKRRRAVFTLAGFIDDAAYQTEEARLSEVQKSEEAKRALEHVRKKAMDYKILMDGQTQMTVAAYVEHLIETGHVKIVSRPKGRAKLYYLHNPVTQVSYPIVKRNGSLDYAKLVVEKLPA